MSRSHRYLRVLFSWRVVSMCSRSIAGPVALVGLILLAACGTVADFASDGGPRVYGGVSHTAGSFGRHVNLGHPVSAVFAIFDFPLSAVFDTLLLPVSIAKSAGEVDPKVENARQVQQACEHLAIALVKGLDSTGQKVAVFEFKDVGSPAVEAVLIPRFDAGLRKAIEDTGKVGSLVAAADLKKAMADNGITQVDDPLVVRSLCQQLDAGAIVIATCTRADQKVTLRVSLRSAEDGLEHATCDAEVTFLVETATR